MKCRVWVETEVEAEVSLDDMMSELAGLPEPEKAAQAIRLLSICLSIVKRVPDAIIATLTNQQRHIIHSTLAEEHLRYAPVPDAVSETV